MEDAEEDADTRTAAEKVFMDDYRVVDLNRFCQTFEHSGDI